MIQQAIAQVMGPIFDAGFFESSFGFRPRRSAHGALRQVQADIKAGYRIAVEPSEIGTPRAGERLKEASLTRFLTRRLKLQVKPSAWANAMRF